MALPTSGPFVKTAGSGVDYWKWVSSYRQKRPYDLQLPFRQEHGAVTLRRGLDADGASVSRLLSFIRDSNLSGGRDIAWNKARARFLSEIGDTASLGVTLAQGRQAMSMMTVRLAQLARFARAVRSLDSKLVSRELGIPQWQAHRVMLPYRDRFPQKGRKSPFGYDVKRPPKDVYERERALADLWLEFWFGWKPLVSDIQASMEVLDAPFKAVRVRGTGKHVTEAQWGGEWPATEVVKLRLVTYRCAFGADVAVTNPNLRLAQQMGILNPFVVAFELIPWSFVFGWFVNLQDYLSSFTDFAGLTLSRGYISRKVLCEVELTWRPCEVCSESDKALYASSLIKGWAEIKERSTLTDIPRPVLRSSLFRLSPTRGLTSIALLLQQAPKVR